MRCRRRRAAAGGGISDAWSWAARHLADLTDGSTITTTLVGSVIVGVVDKWSARGQAAFAIAIDASTGVVTSSSISASIIDQSEPQRPVGLGSNTVAAVYRDRRRRRSGDVGLQSNLGPDHLPRTMVLGEPGGQHTGPDRSTKARPSRCGH